MYNRVQQLWEFLHNDYNKVFYPFNSQHINSSTLQLLKEFLPSFKFLGKFLLIYFIGSILYGIYVESYSSRADGITWWVSNQTVSVLKILGYDSGLQAHKSEPKVILFNGDESVVNMFEGCNGINIMVLFIAFIVASSTNIKPMSWFIPLGLLLIHLANLTRIVLLYWVAQFRPDYMYFTHKYIFTAIIYSAVFLLWVWWIAKFSGLRFNKRLS